MINNTKDKIRYVAFRLFLENGYEATNIRDICEEVNIKASSLYFYYKSKQELFFSIYNDIWSEKIKYIHDMEEIKQNIYPNMKFYYLYVKTMEYYTKDIAKQKFLLRYFLFPPEEISVFLREKFKFWANEENKIILDIINECLEGNKLDRNRSPNDYLLEYKKFENSQVVEMIISNIRLSSKELDASWLRFWNCTMSNYL